MKSMLFASRISWSLARLIWKKIWLMWSIILKLSRMMGNSEFVIMNINYVLLELLLLGNVIWNSYILGNSDLLIFSVSLLVILKLDSWLVRSLFAICGLILIDLLMDRCYPVHSGKITAYSFCLIWMILKMKSRSLFSWLMLGLRKHRVSVMLDFSISMLTRLHFFGSNL